MSIYDCIDIIDDVLRAGRFKGAAFPLEEEKRDLLLQFSTELGEISELESIEIINQRLQDLKTRMLGANIPQLFYPLGRIIQDLIMIIEDRTAPNKPIVKLTSKQEKFQTAYDQLMQSKLRLLELQQNNMKMFGLSLGVCYGMTFFIADSRTSPYRNPQPKEIKLTQAIHNYQKYQDDRSKDQGRIKRKRLTSKRFCPSLQQQAKQLFQMASKHQGKDLGVSLRVGFNSHMTYLSVQPNGKIWYADSNHGVFVFDNEDQFVSAYRLMYLYSHQKLARPTYNVYEVSELIEDKDNTLQESITLAGKWRSFLTGKKYGSFNVLDPNIWFNLLIWGAVWAVFGGVLASVFPIIGIFVGAALGAELGLFFGLCLALFVLSRNHRGLLGTYHYLREKAYVIGEFLRAKLGLKRECDEVPQLDLPTTMQTSYAGMAANHKRSRTEGEAMSNGRENQNLGEPECLDKQQPQTEIFRDREDRVGQYNGWSC